MSAASARRVVFVEDGREHAVCADEVDAVVGKGIQLAQVPAHAGRRVQARVVEAVLLQLGAGQVGGRGAPVDQLAQEAAVAAADVEHAHCRQVRTDRACQQPRQHARARRRMAHDFGPVPGVAGQRGAAVPLAIDVLDAFLLDLVAHRCLLCLP
jgi:hypothetical protein